MHYKTGFALAFLGKIIGPLFIIMGLFGYCTYRFRETKAMSFGQFLEMRYNRKFRIFAAVLRSFSEMLANMIMPAIAARFFIYFLDLPHNIYIFGVTIPSGLNNDHVFRHRAPLVMARVDTDELCIIRETQQIVVPEQGARLGNFGVCNISENETWVVVSEWMQSNPKVCEKYGSDNSVFAARIIWST